MKGLENATVERDGDRAVISADGVRLSADADTAPELARGIEQVVPYAGMVLDDGEAERLTFIAEKFQRLAGDMKEEKHG